MTHKKKPLRVAESPKSVQSPAYPSKKELTDRRAFLQRVGKVGFLGAAGYLLSACDEVDSPNTSQRISSQDTADSEYLAGGDTTDSTLDTGIDTEYLAGVDMPDTALDTGIDTEYLAGDIAPDSDTGIDTGTVIDTDYLAGGEPLDTGIDTGVDTTSGGDAEDTDGIAGAPLE